MAKCTICLSRKGKRKCLVTHTFICNLCCGQIWKEHTCSSCSYFNQTHYAKSGRKILLERIKKSEFFEGKKVVASESKEKMSEIIMDFAEPMLSNLNDNETKKKAINVAILVWNAFVLPKKERDQTIKKLIFTLSLSDSKRDLAISKTIINALMQRRKKYFSYNKRIIIDYQFSRKGEDLRLDVASMPAA